MNTGNMLIIVPDLFPNINGVGDNALILARELWNSNKLGFLVAGNPRYNAAELDGIWVRVLKSQTDLDLYESIANDNTIHLHYVGYGYAKRGAPAWLLRGLKKWKKLPGKKLITTFHELYATSNKPWESSFWLSNRQQHICKELALMSDHMITSTEVFGEKLRAMSGKSVTVLPVLSNVGEPEVIIPAYKRANQMVIFGGRASRRKTYDLHTTEINRLVEKLKLERVMDIGEELEYYPSINTSFEKKGRLSPEEISKILNESKFAFLGAFDSRWFAKSGVFAAYAAHGVVVINNSEYPNPDGLYPGINYLSFSKALLSHQEDYEKVSSNAYKWYSNHNIIKTVKLFKSCYSK